MIVADGTNLDTANSYVDLSYADSYLANNDAWNELDDSDKEQALIDASYSLDLMYGDAFIGSQINEYNQDLEWPRTDQRYGVIPLNLKKAVCENVIRIQDGGGDVSALSDMANVKAYSYNLGGALQESFQYSGDGQVSEHREGMMKIEMLLRKLITDLDGGHWPDFLDL